MIVFDTNVISEVFRPSPEPRVVNWTASLTGDVAITSVTLAELLAGVRRLPDGRRKDELAHGIDGALEPYRCPGVVDTPMSRADMGRPDGFEGTGLPVISASQLANQALFLASHLSAPMNGTTLVSDFGYLARSALGTLDFDDSH